MRLSDKIAAFIANQPHFSVNAVVCFIAGILTYFALPFEPDVGVTAVAFTGVVGLWVWVWKRPLVRYSVCFLFFFVFGLLNANLHGAFTHTVMPRTILNKVFLTGTVTNSVHLRKGQTVELDINEITGISPDKTPTHVRVSARFHQPLLRPGQQIRALVTLFPINRPARSLSPDMSRIAFFEGTGMSGVLHKAWIKSEPDTPTFGRVIDNWRTAIATRINHILPRETQGIVKALIIGEQRDILDHTRFLYRVSGIYHVLSVSGLHMSLIALFFFVIFTRILSLSVWLDEKISTQKIAAVGTLLVAFFYLLLSGMQTPALRSFLMLAFVLSGVFLGRNALSVRTVAVAAFLILLVKPYLILTASFQLSFAAILILISVYQQFADKFITTWRKQGFIFKAFAAVAGVIVTGLLATVATLPTVGYHFHQVAPYGVIGNLATGFLFSFGIMPLLVIAVISMPFGWDAPFLQAAGYLIGTVDTICEYIVTQPFATVVIPAFHSWGLAVALWGIVIICLFRGWKSTLAGFLVIACSLFAFMNVPKPDFMVAENGKLFAARDKDDTLLLSESYLNRFISDTWLLMNGQNPADYWLPKAFRPNTVAINGVTIGLSDKACQNPDVALVLGIKSNRGDYSACAVPVLRRTDFTRDGMHEFYIENGQIRIEKPADTDSKRVWRTHTQ